MAKLKPCVLFIMAIALVAATSLSAAPATIARSTTELENGTYLIRLDVAATGTSIYGLKLIDPSASIVDVYAPKGWVAVTDGEDYAARTGDRPIKSGGKLQFLVHSKTKDIQYTWTVYDPLKQIGSPGTLK
ncbi:MAG: hypothetical protein JW876_08575 [Candidatus Krumholzibacteriota bacterium]|nr:hypothetical protein [Candidatus Krumholzibacteriota bacterium]